MEMAGLVVDEALRGLAVLAEWLSASKAAGSHSAADGQPPKRFVHHPAGQSHRGVVASIFATTAGWLGSNAHPAVAGRSGQAGAVPSDPDPGRRRNTGTGVARPSEGTHTPPEKTPRACGQRRAVPGYLFRGPPAMSDPAGNGDQELLRRALEGDEPALVAFPS